MFTSLTQAYFIANDIMDAISVIEPNYRLPKVVINEKEYVPTKEIENLVEPSLYRKLETIYAQVRFEK